VSDLLDRSGGSVAASPDEPATSTPMVPLVMLVITTAVAIGCALVAYNDEAGTTDEVSTMAVAAWGFGSLIGLLVFGWWGLLDSQRRSTGTYVEPAFRPRLVAGVLVAVGWVAGLGGALMVGLSVARA
jgi:hypothetical protein